MEAKSLTRGGNGSLRSNAVPLVIPRNLARDSGGARETREGAREPYEQERNSFSSSRYQSPRSGRYSFEHSHHSHASSYDVEGTSPFSQLRRPKDKRKTGASVQQTGFHIRHEGFDTRGTSSHGSTAPPRPPSGQDSIALPRLSKLSPVGEVNASPSRPGLLSRTFSSGLVPSTNSDAIKEKLEQCLDSKTSLGDDLDGESISYLRSLQAKHEVFKAPAVSTAFNIASFSYNDRDAGQPVLKQCVETACILAELGMGEHFVASALLKDVLMESMMTEDQLRGLVAPQVADLVIKVGRLDDICQVRRDITEASHGPMDPQVSNRFNRLLLSLADVHGALIKLADRLAALRKAPQGTAQHLRLAHEALEVYAPIANRMGVWSIKAAMEDLAFKALHPLEHAELHGKLRESQDRGTIEKALDTLDKVLQTQGIQGVDLSGRPKNLYGVMRKMSEKQKGLDQVYDVRALRVVVKSKTDCYAVLNQVHRLWPEVPGRFKDYVRHPKSNGYKSLHTVVQLPDGAPMEVQIRTDKMHFIAEYGVAAHWRYKDSRAKQPAEEEGAEESEADAQQVNWARWLINWTLELNDAKCRPSGSPPQDSSLADLAGRICNFPSHNTGCKFAEYASKLVPRPVVQADAPATVILMDHTKPIDTSRLSLEELPPGCTVGQLHAVLAISPETNILVNTLVADDESQVLLAGDRVEVFTAPSDQRLTREQLEVQRDKLQSLLGRSPAAPPPRRSGEFSWAVREPALK